MTEQTENKMTALFAQPYDISANGFYFTNAEGYRTCAATVRNNFGIPVEEFEIQFIDGADLDAELFKAIGVNQCNFEAFLDACNYWDTHQKQKFIIAVGECGFAFNLNSDDPDQLDVDLYEMDSLRELAQHFVDEGLYGEIPESIKYHLDYDSIARDLSVTYHETVIDGVRLIYRCE